MGAGSVFDLLGRNEVDLTAALGWVLAHSPTMLGVVAEQLCLEVNADQVAVALEVADAQGRTDIELTAPATKVVIEAKQGWLVPGEEQLTKYRGRFDGFEHRLLVSMSDSSQRWARDQLPPDLDGIPVRHVPWDTVRAAIRTSLGTAHGRERLWLEELEAYMGRATSTRPYDSQWVFCVVVSDTLFGGMTFRDYVLHERVYFHPFGGNNTWPKRAPNLLCFRWGGRVRQVNRVERFEVVPHLSDRWPAVTPAEDGPHIVYDLGPDIPIPAISTKGTYATGRVWCLLDQLLVQPTLADAVRTSKELSE
ncbi:hypothetical protein ACQPYH_06195 [Kribbella sp. CA-245084]|uniref:hypothetical protein n=1 Tax=Kribbella sp. CA-245084 TaxID=3239940 RepID=UPI003D8B57A2